MRHVSRVLLAIAAAGAAAFPLLGTGVAGAATSAAYVSPRGTPGQADTSCGTAAYSSINQAIGAVPAGGTVVVCRGIYHTQAVVQKSVRLIGRGAVINAKGQKPLLPKLPGGSGIAVLGAHRVIIRGFRVINAGFDAILVGLSSGVQVRGNVLEHNGGVGVDFNGSSYSQAYHNISRFNVGGGFLVADDVGAAHNNVVSWNVADHNPGGCGVIVAGHGTAGVWDNTIGHNLLTYNGTNPKLAGAGVVIATEVKHETVSGNVVIGNTIYGNGIAGVTIHGHLAGLHMNQNEILGNDIGTNNVLGDPIGLAPPVRNYPDRFTTGILVGSSSYLHVLILGNRIHDNHYGVYVDGRVRVTFGGNHFRRVRIQVRFT
jgi:Right handed beta helix region